MAKEKLEDLSMEKLRKRKKITFVMLCVMIGAASVSIIVSLVSFIVKKQLIFYVLGNIFVCLFFILFFYQGLKSINGEISRRESK
jgi:hypothetical protein